MPIMTTAHPRANWIRPPSLTELWLEALLRAFAMLWSAIAATFQMSPSRRARECDTPPAPQALPRRTRDPIKEHAPGPPPSTTTTTTTSGCRTATANASSRETTEILPPRSEAHPQPEDGLAAHRCESCSGPTRATCRKRTSVRASREGGSPVPREKSARMRTKSLRGCSGFPPARETRPRKLRLASRTAASA